MLAALTAVLCSCSDAGSGKEAGRVVIKYWEKWTGFEADAMRAVVDDFNASQNRIFVEFSSVSQIDRRLMLATAGGVPPDVAGIWGKSLPVYAENNALTPLDRLAAEGGVKRDQYIDIFWQICSYRGHLWALPTTPGSLALVWNKKLFREAGLDPERPPQSLAELEQFNDKLVKRRPDGSLAAVGFLPAEPGWWNEIWGWWFGGELWDGRKTITANSPDNVAAFEWIASYPRRFGVRDVLAFRDGFGNFASPQNPFFTGRVAMVLQGPWIYNFIKNFAPADFEWGVAPFPSVDPARFQNITQVETDALVIPAGAKHPKEAFEFIRYVNSQKPMEKLCLGQRKFSPLRECSAEFFQKHPNPHIGEFLALAKSPNARFVPQLTVWSLYSNDMTQAFGRVWTEKATARESLDEVQQHVQQAFDHQQKRWERISEKLTKKWDKP
jgi:ABC-type glycerol-3-phosphate transport system substrate-binding protein